MDFTDEKHAILSALHVLNKVRLFAASYFDLHKLMPCIFHNASCDSALGTWRRGWVGQPSIQSQ